MRALSTAPSLVFISVFNNWTLFTAIASSIFLAASIVNSFFAIDIIDFFLSSRNLTSFSVTWVLVIKLSRIALVTFRFSCTCCPTSVLAFLYLDCNNTIVLVISSLSALPVACDSFTCSTDISAPIFWAIFIALTVSGPIRAPIPLPIFKAASPTKAKGLSPASSASLTTAAKLLDKLLNWELIPSNFVLFTIPLKNFWASFSASEKFVDKPAPAWATPFRAFSPSIRTFFIISAISTGAFPPRAKFAINLSSDVPNLASAKFAKSFDSLFSSLIAFTIGETLSIKRAIPLSSAVPKLVMESPSEYSALASTAFFSASIAVSSTVLSSPPKTLYLSIIIWVVCPALSCCLTSSSILSGIPSSTTAKSSEAFLYAFCSSVPIPKNFNIRFITAIAIPAATTIIPIKPVMVIKAAPRPLAPKAAPNIAAFNIDKDALNPFIENIETFWAKVAS